MKKLQQNNIDLLSQGITSFFDIMPYKDIIDFALNDVDLSDDVSSDKNKVDLENYVYLVQPLKACAIESNIRKEVVISFPEQMGKTMIQMIALLYNAVYNNLQALICYPSLELAVETSNIKFIPLFKKIEQFKQQIEKPFAIRSDRLKLSNAVIYWQGAGSKIVSKSAKLVLGDQCSIWETPHNVNNINELKKRTRSYSECLQLFVSTPRYKQDHFWRQFLQGSQGYFFLQCQGCGKHSLRSCDIHNLQFQTVYNEELKQYVAIRGSQRLICPSCKYEHHENEKESMIKNGKYLHKFPDRIKDYPTFQAGVLASLLNVHSWGNIADIQLSSGKSATLEDFISFDNSIRGLPYQQREINKQDETALSKHYFKMDELKSEQIEAVIIASDTQDTFSVYAVVALTRNNNYYVLEMGRVRYLWLDDQERKIIDSENKRNNKQPEKTLLDILDSEYKGITPLALFVDMRGHRSDQVKNLSKMRKNIFLYAGTNLKYDKFKVSDNNPKMFLCDAKKYQSELIFMLHFATNKESNYLFLPDDITEKDIAELIAFQPDTEKRNGNLYENWTCGNRVHDMADTVKLSIAGFSIFSKIFRKDRFRFGEAKILNQNPIQKKPLLKKPLLKKPLF